ncbi:hypothetical protein HK405_004944 [Cladochytrium tenue]|nr:hypothetical protein HK405_004944 [Cladochytrium tenue]
MPSNPPFYAEHIGSLLRPATLLTARTAFDDHKIPYDDLRPVEDAAVADAVALLQSTGIRSITDGEYRRFMFFDGFFEMLDGFELVDVPDRSIFKMYVPDVAGFLAVNAGPVATMLCTGKIRRRKNVESPYCRQFAFLKSLLPGQDHKNIKITMAAPEWYHLRHSSDHAFSKDAYESDVGYFADIAAAYREELAALYDIGCRYFQIDDPLLAYFCSESMLKGMREDGKDPEVELDKYIQLYNDCLKEIPDDMCASLHLCRGNFKDGMHFSEGGYEHIADKLFNSIPRISTFFLEYDTDRAGDFTPLAKVPRGKRVILGIVSSKRPDLEDKGDVKSKVLQAAEIMARGQGVAVDQALLDLGLSPQCGFASHAEGNPVTREHMEAKLRLVREVADDIWDGKP